MVDAYKKDLLNLNLEDVYKKYILAGEIWYFKDRFKEEWFGKYNEFKLFVSDKLGVQFNDVAIAGSAKVGFSLNPKKNYKLFDDDSDVDIIVISQTLFYKFWYAYLDESYTLRGIKKYNYVCSCIFRRFISFDGANMENPVFAEWAKKTKGFEKDLQLIFGIRHDVHYRIFESWEAAEKYYLSGMKKTKQKLEADNYAVD